MKKREIRVPFLLVNPKSYIYGDESLELAHIVKDLANQYDIDVIFTAQLVDIPTIVRMADAHMFITAQAMDGIVPGRGMGAILPEALKNVGVDAVVLNHAEKPMTMFDLDKAMRRADELGMLTIVVADTVEQCRAIACMKPDMMICEATGMIATGKTSDDDYVIETTRAVRTIDANIKIIQAAGISSGDDVYRMCHLGADCSGGTTGVLNTPDRRKRIEDMMQALVRIREEK